MNTPTESDGLFWEAFQFAAGELSPEAAESFESLLADDQQAREALAQAVEMGRAVDLICGQELLVLPRAVPSSRAKQGHTIRWRRWQAAMWTLAGAAACLAVVAAVGPWNSADSESPSGSSAHVLPVQPAEKELALRWASASSVWVESLDDAGAEDEGEGSAEDIEPFDVASLDEQPGSGAERHASENDAEELAVPSYYSRMAEIYADWDDVPQEPEDF